MAIKVHCPTCKKNLAVPDEAAGKKIRCRSCKNILSVPAPVSKPAPGSAPAPVSAPADAETLAASVFSDPPPAAEVEEPQFVEFRCPQCDEPLKLSANLAGKQSPCPECRRIIKVPLMQKREAADWRNQQKKLPSGARQNFESDQPEGALAATVAATAVSQEALQEAGVIKEKREPLTRRQWAVRIGAVVTALVVFGVGGYWLWSSSATSRQERAVVQALKAVAAKKDNKFSPEMQAEVNRAAGEYYLGTNRRRCVDKANGYFKTARGLLANRAGTAGDLALIDLALSQIELAGEGKAVDNGERLSWKDTPNELRQTLEKINAPEAKMLALREVSRRLLSKGHQNVAALLATAIGNGHPDAPGVVGLELLTADPKHAETLANQGLDSLPLGGAAAARQEAAPSSLIALCVALRPKEQDPCRGRLPEVPKQAESNDPNIALGWIEGLARQGNAAAARQLIGKLSTPQMAFQGYVVLAAAEAPDAAQADAQEAIKLLEAGTVSGKNVSPWLLLRLVKTALDAGLLEKAPVAANAIPDPGLRGRAQLEVLRKQLETGKKKTEPEQANVVDKQTPVHPLAWEALARNNARLDGGMLQAVQSWEENVRPLGLVGAALGAQDGSR